jgi:hypothetical protein
MNRAIVRVALASGSALLLAACGHVNTQIDPSAHLTHFNHIFVEHRLADGRGVDQLVVAELQRLGYDASSGPMTMMPDNAEAIVAYNDVWTFDFTTYLYEFDVAVRDAHTGKEIAVNRYSRPSVVGTDPIKIVNRVIDPIFQRK